MDKIIKIINKIKQNKKNDIQFSNLEKLLIHFGHHKVRQKGSHVHFRKKCSPFIVSEFE